MKLKATCSALALAGCLTSHAQNQTVTNLTVTNEASVQSHLGLGPSIGSAEWLLIHNWQTLRVQPGWGGGSISTLFNNDGSVSFPSRVSVGDVSCATPSACTNMLGINNMTLAVGGKIGARGGVFVVNLGGTWPDYVFSPDYQLRPLSEVARYIQANHHLPDVTSAGQVAAEGIELAAMNATLLRKVEELTLHLIELQKQNQALTERVAKLEATH